VPATEQLDATKERVREFWEREPCGVMHTDAAEGTPEFYEQVARQRDEAEPYIPEFADFADSRGKRVLEIGVGVGSDFVRFARAGADATGVDLTEHAVALVRRRLELEGLTAEVVRADAESLPFDDGSFDRVYSWGVLHHTPQTERAVAEALRVIEPGGTFCIMLYGRYSWVAFALWAKYGLLKGRPWRSLADVLAHHMESEGTKGYTRRELRAMFRDARDVRIDSVVTVYDRNFLGPFARFVPARRLGWFMVVRGRR
jgi:SAM-dependent methyltransferase